MYDKNKTGGTKCQQEKIGNFNSGTKRNCKGGKCYQERESYIKKYR